MQVLPQIVLHALLIIDIHLTSLLRYPQGPRQRNSTCCDPWIVLIQCTNLRIWRENGVRAHQVLVK